MKKLLKSVSFLVFLGVAMLLSRCEKNTDNQPSILEIPVINLSQSLGSDGMVTVRCTVTNADSVFCNNVYITNYEIRFPACDSILVFVAKNELYKVNKSIQITKPASPTGDVSFTYNGLVVDSLPYPGGVIVATINFANGDLVFNGNTYHKSPVSINLTTIGTEVFDFTIKGICEEITISLIVPVKELSHNIQNMLFTWRAINGEESYDSINWVNDGVDYTVIDCITDNVYIFTATYFISDWKTLCSGGVDNPSPHTWDLLSDGTFVGLSPQRKVYLPVGETYTWVYYNPEYQWDPESQKFIEIKRWRRETFAHVNL